MFKEQGLEECLANGATRKVFVSVTREFLAQSVSVFDGALAALCQKLGEIEPRVHFRFNMSAERYGIEFPEGMSSETIQRVTAVLKDTKLEIAREAHFGMLF